MSGTSLSRDTACRSLGFVDWPPRGYFRTVKTCIAKPKNLTVENDLCVGGEIQTDRIVPKSTDTSPATPVTLDGDLCVTGDILTDRILPKTTNASPASPATPVTVEGDACVTGVLQVDCIEPKTNNAYLQGFRIVAAALVRYNTSDSPQLTLLNGCNIDSVTFEDNESASSPLIRVTLTTEAIIPASRFLQASSATNATLGISSSVASVYFKVDDTVGNQDTVIVHLETSGASLDNAFYLTVYECKNDPTILIV